MFSLDEILIEKYISGQCSEAEMQQIFEWLNVSEDNRKEWLKLRMIPVKSNFLHFYEPEHVARSYRELMKEQSARELLERKITRKIILRMMQYAASIILLIGLSFATYKYFSYHEPIKMVVVAVSGNEPVKQIRLDDSTRVWLSAGSHIEYPEKFNKNERNVSIEGKVYFEVAKDANRPFLVKTEAYTVKVLGTSFEVSAFKYKQFSDVVLVEGKIEILDNQKTTLCTLLPGQQFKMDKITNHFDLNKVDARMYAAWHSGNLEFDGLTLAEIAKAIERHYNVRIVFEKGIAKNRKLVGSLSFKKDIYEMMRTIAMVVPITYNVRTDTVVHIQSNN